MGEEWLDEDLREIAARIPDAAIVEHLTVQQWFDAADGKFPLSKVEPIAWKRVPNHTSFDWNNEQERSACGAEITRLCEVFQTTRVLFTSIAFASHVLSVPPPQVVQAVLLARRLPGGWIAGPADWEWAADIRSMGSVFVGTTSGAW